MTSGLKHLGPRGSREVITNVTCDVGAPGLDLGTEAGQTSKHREASSRLWLST
jgi:hypothetical protein